MTDNKCELKLHGSVNIGSKGQIVIPKDVRDIVGINPGDNLIIFTKGTKAIGLVKAEDLNELIKYIKNEMNDENTNNK